MSNTSTAAAAPTGNNRSGNITIPDDRNQESTVFVNELAPEVTEDLLWELMLQAGPVLSVHIPKDRETNVHSGFGFVEFAAPRDADYAARIMNGVPLFGHPIRAMKSKFGKNLSGGAILNVGASLFIGNLDPSVDERLLLDTFSSFGEIIMNPKIARDAENRSKGYAFINFDSFESSDAAIEKMNGQFLCNRPISVAYAFKNDGSGERHGTQAERQLAQKMMGSRPKVLTPAAAAAATAASLANIIPSDIPSAAISSVYGISQQSQQQQPPQLLSAQVQQPVPPQPQIPLLPLQQQQQQLPQIPPQFSGIPQLPPQLQPPVFPMPMQLPQPQQNAQTQPLYPPGFVPY